MLIVSIASVVLQNSEPRPSAVPLRVDGVSLGMELEQVRRHLGPMLEFEVGFRVGHFGTEENPIQIGFDEDLKCDTISGRVLETPGGQSKVGDSSKATKNLVIGFADKFQAQANRQVFGFSEDVELLVEFQQNKVIQFTLARNGGVSSSSSGLWVRFVRFTMERFYF